jgi:hypothetical protein
MGEAYRFEKIDLNSVPSSSSDHIGEKESLKKTSIILVVTRNAHLAEPVMEYTLNLAGRLNCRLLAAYVDTLPFLVEDGKRNKKFISALLQSAAVYKNKAMAKGVSFNYVQESGKIGKVINRLCHIAKRIEFVVIDRGIKIEEAVSRAPVPVFNINYNTFNHSEREPWLHKKIFLQRISKR